MKDKERWICYIVGLVLGIVITLICSWAYNRIQDSKIPDGLTLLQEPREVMDFESVTIVHTIKGGVALAEVSSETFSVLYIDRREELLYDGKTITLGYDEWFRIVGTFRYKNDLGVEATVPVVTIIKKPGIQKDVYQVTPFILQ